MMSNERSRGCILAALVFGALLSWGARADAEEAPDVVEGRLTLQASYGFLAAFYQGEAARGYNPAWGHGVYFRLGGERCGVICGGLSVLGNVNIMPSASGSVGVGPHLGMRWDGPDWAKAYVFRAGAAYIWTVSPEPSFGNEKIEFGDNRSGHGLGAWLSIGIEFGRRESLLTPVVGVRGRYVAVMSTDPVEHHLSAQAFFAVTLGRRLDFSPPAELEVPLDEDEETAEDEDEDEERSFDLDEHDEQRLREAEEELRE